MFVFLQTETEPEGFSQKSVDDHIETVSHVTVCVSHVTVCDCVNLLCFDNQVI